MPAPVTSWNLVRLYATWRELDGSLKEGTYRVLIPVRITNSVDGAIIPAGVYAEGALATVEGEPSLDLLVPATDDPDNDQTGWKLTVEVHPVGAPGERYSIEVPVAARPVEDGGSGDGVDLSNAVLERAGRTSPTATWLVGVPGGLARLDADGDVLDGSGSKVTGGSGGGGGADGEDGASAYEVAVANGFSGTVQEWLDSLVGPEGPQGPAGADGATGPQGPAGNDGADGADGATGPQGPAGADGAAGASAYEVAVAEGFVGTEQAWLDSLVGPTGPQGPAGADGADGATGPQGPAGNDGADGATGPAGADGDSAYEVAVAQGFVGTEQDWLDSLVGPTGPQGPAGNDGADGATGPQGPAGPGLAAGGTTGQMAVKASGTDYDVTWVDQPSGGGGITDAPTDGEVYARQSGTWVVAPVNTGPAGADGADGASAYEVAVAEGFVGTEQDWLDSLVGPTGPQGPAGNDGADGATGPQGPAGNDGADGATGPQGPAGASAYEVAVAEGFVGTEQDWLDSLVGPAGADGADGATGPQGPAGNDGADGATGPQGPDGDSAYEVAVAQGFVGTEQDWLDSLVGADGATGPQGPAGNDGADGATGPQGPAGNDGADGASAYEVAVAEGFVGTEQDWLDSLVGPTGPAGADGADGATGPQGPAGNDGATGADGASAYEVAVAEGFVGTEQDWLDSLVGADGATGPQGPAGNDGADGATGPQGPAGADGDSAYEVAVAQGFVGTEQEWLDSLVGADGATGPQGPAGNDGADGATGPQGPAGNDGADGASAYEVAVAQGFVGTEQDWLDSLVGADGATGPQGPAGNDGADGATGPQGPAGNDGVDGASAYEVAVAEGFVGTEQDWLDSLVGPQGPAGADGADGADGGGTANYTLTVTGTPNTATYTLTEADGTTTAYADTGTTSGLKAALEAIEVAHPEGGVHLHFGAGRFHFLDAPVGNESWAGVEDHHTWGSSAQLMENVTISGEGPDATIISNRTNWSGSADTEPFSFTLVQGITIRDLSVESCGSYKSTTDAIDFDQGSKCRVVNVVIRRSRSRGIVFDGGDDGRHATGNYLQNLQVQGRPAQPNVVAFSGGSLSASTVYDYALAWVDSDLGGAQTAADTRPSDPARLTTGSSNRQVRVHIPRAPYSATGTKVYRRSTPDGGWRYVATVAGNLPTVFVDDGTAGTSAATFGTDSTIPQAGVEFLATSDSTVTGCVIEGIGGASATVQYGINIVRKSSVPTGSDRNIITANNIRGSLNSGVRIAGGSHNLVDGNIVSSPGTNAAKVSAVRIEGISGVATDRNRVVNNGLIDARTSDHPEGGVGISTGVTITATNSPTGNVVEHNTIVGAATSAAISDSGTDSVIRLNSGSGTSNKDGIGVGDLEATGTASSTTYLRGDGTWATPAGGGGGSDLGPSWENVMDHGAVGDGSTDDTAAIIAARDAAGVAGQVYFPYTGNAYVIDPVKPLSYQTWYGQHSPRYAWDNTQDGGSVLRARGAQTAVIYNDNNTSNGVATQASRGVTIRNLGIQGGANYSGRQARGIDFGQIAGPERGWTVRDCSFNFCTTGIAGYVWVSTISYCHFSRNDYGIAPDQGLGGGRFNDAVVSYNYLYFNRDHAISLGGASEHGLVILSHNRVERGGALVTGSATYDPTGAPENTFACGIYISRATCVTLLGNTSDANTGPGLCIRAASHGVVNNVQSNGNIWKRDGIGDNTTGAGGQNAGVEVKDAMYVQVRDTITYGDPNDGGAGNPYPYYGFQYEANDWLTFDGSVQLDTNGNTTARGIRSVGSANWMCSIRDTRQPVFGFPAASTANAPTAGLQQGSSFYNTTTDSLWIWDGSAWDDQGAGGGTTDHSALSNLDADDHPQYALADGSRGNVWVINSPTGWGSYAGPPPAGTLVVRY